MSNYLKRKFPSLGSLGSDASASFLRAARGGNLDKVLDYIKNGTDINTCNQNGLNALHLASKEGHGHIVSELLTRGAHVDAVTKKGNSALHVASLAGQEEIVRLLVQAGANVNAQSQNGFTPLYMAAQENHDSVVRYLLSNGANQSIATEDGFTPLAVALQQGHDKVVAVLLENDTRGKVRLPALHIAAKKDDCKSAILLLQSDHKSDVTSKSGFTPLHIAAHYGNQNIAALLLDKGADINYMAKHHITPLHVAAKWGKAAMVGLLCERGANQEAKTRDGLTPLHCAARSGHENVVDLMLEKGAFISAKTKNGLTPLHMAAQGDHVDAARILFYHKAPVDDVTVDYLTALHVAAHCGHVKVAKLLLDRHADPNSRALNGFTPMHIACKKNRIEVVELLLKYGANIEATTESGLTPLHVASFMGCMNIVIYLLQHDAKPNHATVRGETPLHLAARANQADIIRILLRNRAEVDAQAREQQTPLHIAARLGNADIVMMLLQHGAAADSTTKDLYTALHIAAKEGQDEVAQVLLDHGASLSAVTKKGFTPLHLAAKYGNMRVAKTLLAKDAPVDAQGKNGVTPLHVAAHYDHQAVALLLLDKGASVSATAKNGYTPLHIAAKKNQMDIATTLLEYGAEANCESKAGFTPLHLASQDGHSDMSTLLIEHKADVNHRAKNGLTPLHLCAQEDRVPVAAILVKSGAAVGPETAAGYTPLHVASHFGQLNMVRFLLQHQAEVNPVTSAGYTPLHQAAQQGHTLIISLLLEHKAQPNAMTNTGQTALSIAQRLGYISVVETLKVVTETIITTTTTTVTEEKYRVLAPETMQEAFISDSEDEGGDDFLDSAVYGRPSHAQHVHLPYYEGQMELCTDDQPLGDSTYKYLTVDEMKSLGDDSMPMDTSRDETFDRSRDFNTDWISNAPPIEEMISPQKLRESYAQFTGSFAPDNVDISRSPVTAGFLVSFMVDARGGAMRGCRHSGVRVIVPPRKAAQPMRITCRYLKKDKLLHPPPLMEGEAIASRILEMGPAQAKFLGPVIIEVPHFASLRGREREIVILRSDNGETWKEHTLEASEEAVQEVLNESFDGDELKQLEDLNTSRITRIVTTDFPQYFAIVSRLRQEVHAIGTEGGMVSSTVVPQVQAVFQPGALTKKIKVGLQAQPIPPELVAKLLGNRVAVSPIVTIEPRRRKFHKPITLTIPVPQAAAKGMINQYSGDVPTLRLLCSITGGTTRAQWEDVTGSTPLTFVSDCVSFTTTVSARFWLMDCRNVTEATAMATELYKEAIHVPFMAKFVVFAKRHDPLEGRVRVFCMTDDKEEKTLEQQEHFVEVAKSRDVEVLEGKPLYLEFAGNLLPVTKSGDQLNFNFYSFKENRMPFNMRVKDHTQDAMGRVAFMREKKLSRQEAPQAPICNLNISLPSDICPEADVSMDSERLRQRLTPHTVRQIGRLVTPEIHRADIRISDIAHKLGKDWVALAPYLDVPESDTQLIQTEYPDDSVQQATVMLRLWMNGSGHDATGNTLARGLTAIGRDDIVTACITDSVMVTDAMEAAMAKARLDQSGFDSLREELGPSRDTSFRPDLTYDDRDIMKEAESVEDVRVSEVKKAEPVDDRPPIISDADNERKYAAEEKPTVSPPRPAKLLTPITPKDGPATGQVTVTDLVSPDRDEDQIAPVHLSRPEVAAELEREEKRRSLVLRELGNALAEVERTQPPVTLPTRHDIDVPDVSEPTAVSEVKGARSPITAAFVVPTAAIRTQAAPPSQPDDVARCAPTPPSTPIELEVLLPDGTKTTVQQQTSEAVLDDGRIVQKSTTITTTTVGGDSDAARRLSTEGDLQLPEAAVYVKDEDVATVDASLPQGSAASGVRQGSLAEVCTSSSRAEAPASPQTDIECLSLTEKPEILFLVEESERSLLVEEPARSFLVEKPKCSFVVEEPQESFFAENPHGSSVVAKELSDSFAEQLSSFVFDKPLSSKEAQTVQKTCAAIVEASTSQCRPAARGSVTPPFLLDDFRTSSGELTQSCHLRDVTLSDTSSVTSSSSDVMERVLQPELIAGTPEAENYFCNQSHRLQKHALRGEMDIDVDDLENLSVGAAGLYVRQGDIIPERVDIIESGAISCANKGSASSSSLEMLYDEADENIGMATTAAPDDYKKRPMTWPNHPEESIDAELVDVDFPPDEDGDSAAACFDDVYHRSLNDDISDDNSEGTDGSNGTAETNPSVVLRAEHMAPQLLEKAVVDAAASAEKPSIVAPATLVPDNHDGDSDDEFERLEREMEAEADLLMEIAAAAATAAPGGGEDGGECEFEPSHDEGDDDVALFFTPEIADGSPPTIEPLPDDYQQLGSSSRRRSPQPLISTPNQTRRATVPDAGGPPVRRHETFHHVPRVTVTDTDDVRDVTDDNTEGIVVEPDDYEDDFSDSERRPLIVEVENTGPEAAQSPEMFSELPSSAAGPTLTRTVRTETRTQTTFDDAGRPVIRTVTERITTEPDGSETRQTVETED